MDTLRLLIQSMLANVSNLLDSLVDYSAIVGFSLQHFTEQQEPKLRCL